MLQIHGHDYGALLAVVDDQNKKKYLVINKLGQGQVI